MAHAGERQPPGPTARNVQTSGGQPPADQAATPSEGLQTGGDECRRALGALSGANLGSLSRSSLEASAAQQNLQVLDLKDNKMPTVPAEIYRAFTQVKVLDIRKNALEELLPAISAMRVLEDLLADQNRLRELPPEVCRLPHLKSLSLSQNLLKSLPQAIGEMRQLRHLSLGDNRIEEIPLEIGSCKGLQMLHLHHNHFTRLPSSLGQLDNITELALEWFRYTTPPLPRVIKGAEWKRVIKKLLDICKEKMDRGEQHITCIEVLSNFSQKAFDPNAIDSKRRTRLHVACLEGHAGMAMSLAVNGSRCDLLDCDGYSPLLVAVREEHQDIATAIVGVGVDVNRGGGLFGSPLHVATVNFDPHMVQLLLHGRAEVNQMDADGNTPLHVLMSVFDKGHKRAGAIGQVLLKYSADCNVMNSDKWAPLHLAARRGQLKGICFVLRHIDSVNVSCLKGSCSHQSVSKKSKNSRARACARAFDLNLRGGSHLWTPLHLAGHACHVSVVQVLIEAAADVFTRNVDSRTARYVARGNLAISKLLRKAEDEWLWYRIHRKRTDAQGGDAGVGTSLDGAVEVALDAQHGVAEAPAEEAAAKPLQVSPKRNGDTLLESLEVNDNEDDTIEQIAKSIEGPVPRTAGEAGDGAGVARKGLGGPPDLGGPPALRVGNSRLKVNTIMEKCRDMHVSRAEVQHIRATNFAVPITSVDEFASKFTKIIQQGPKHLLFVLLSKPWAKEMVTKLLDEERFHNLLLEPGLVTNEDFIRLLICNLPREKLPCLGKIKNKEQETLLHVLCKAASSRGPASAALCADILLLLLTVCSPEIFDLEAKDLRGQTALHLAAQSGDIGLVQVLLEYGANPNAQEDTTGWTPLHFSVAKAHYALVLQLLHHDATDVNQVDRFDWPPLLEACSRLDVRSTSLLVNGGANLAFRNQHQFDVLKAVDTSKKDLAAKRWMSCLMVSNGFRFEESAVQLNQEDRAILERESSFFETRSRSAPFSSPPFLVPDHLAPRCHACKVLFSVTLRRYHCRSCGIVLCGDCFRWRDTNIVTLDERLRTQQLLPQESRPGSSCWLRPKAMPDMPLGDGCGGSRPAPWSWGAQPVRPGRVFSKEREQQREAGGPAAVEQASPRAPAKPGEVPTSTALSEDSFEEPSLAEEPPVGPPASVAIPASMMGGECAESHRQVRQTHESRPIQGALSRERGSLARSEASLTRFVRLCAPCSTFFEAGVGEALSALSQQGY